MSNFVTDCTTPTSGIGDTCTGEGAVSLCAVNCSAGDADSESTQNTNNLVDIVNTSANDNPNECAPSTEKPFPRYYLRNFFTIIDSVLLKNPHLFIDNELEMITNFRDMNESMQR